MAMKHRLSSVVCQELAEAKYAQDLLLAEVDRAAADGHIDADEWRRILVAQRTMIREMHEAEVAAEQHDLVLARFEYALRAGPHAEPHQYLREKARDVAALSAGHDDEGKRPNLRLVMSAGKRKAPAVTEARRASRQQSK